MAQLQSTAITGSLTASVNISASSGLFSTNVGIGTSSPGAALDVVGVVQWQASAGTVLGKLSYSNGEPTLIANTGLGLRFWTNNTLAAYLDSSGNVIIGSTTPSTNAASVVQKFNVNTGATDKSGISIQHGLTAAEAYTVVGAQYAYNNALSSAEIRYINTALAGATMAIGFATHNGASLGERMRLDSQGNLGIGTTSPSSKLHVQGIARFTDGTTTTLIENGSGVSYIGTITNHPLVLTANNTEWIRLTAAGNVGIGTSSPSSILHIQSSNQYIRFNNSSAGDGGLKISYNNQDNHGLHLTYNPANALSYIDNTYPTASGLVWGDIYFRQNVNGTMTTRMAIQAQTGNVGIGTTSPNYKLVASNGGANGLEIDPANASGTQTAVLSYNRSTSAYTPLVIQASNVNIGSPSYPMFISGSGAVGIGTTVPSASLHVSGTMMIQGVIEKVNLTGSAPPTTLNIDATSGSVFYNSGSSANNWTVNFRGSAATTLNSMMYNGQSMTFAVLVNHGATGYTASAHQVDGVSITPRWQGGTLPSGSGTSTDIYSYTLIKTANAAFNIFASQTKFA